MPFVLFIGLVVGLLWFLVLMVPAIPFARMICSQEQEGLVLDDEMQLISRGIVGTYLGDAWLIHAGHVALHYSRIASGRSTPAGDGGQHVLYPRRKGGWPKIAVGDGLRGSQKGSWLAQGVQVGAARCRKNQNYYLTSVLCGGNI